MESSQIESYIDFLMERKEYDEASKELVKLVNDETYKSMRNSTKYDLWNLLCDLITNYPEEIKSINVEKVILGGIKKFQEEFGKLWCYLATYYIKMGMIEKAYDIYERGMTEVKSVKDFTQIFDSYANFQELIIKNLMESKEEEEEDELELRIKKLEYLLDRRLILLSGIKLKQNPHNVYEWLKRISLFDKDENMTIKTYNEAINTIDPIKSIGKLKLLWINFAKLYENKNDIQKSREIYLNATKINFKNVDDLASIWCEWVEMELR
jgi:pre-mRNA-splicing factor SYF1